MGAMRFVPSKKTVVVFVVYLVIFFLSFSPALIFSRLIDPGDSRLNNYPLHLYYATCFIKHGLHWWLPYEFLGLPYLGTMQTGIFYPLNMIYFLIPPPYAFTLLF